MIVLITGGTQGIGKAIARAFIIKHNATIILNYHLNDGEMLKTIEEFNQEFPHTKIMVYKADITREREVIAMISEIVKQYGTIDVLINNAGIFKDAISWKMRKCDWNIVLATNLTGAFLCTKHVLPIMRRKECGRIINISSVVGQTGVFGASNYAASKAGLIGFTKAIAKEVAIKGITVNCVALGYIEVGMNLRLQEELRTKIQEEIPMKRFGKPEEVADVVVFLCSQSASYITGQVIGVNGGCYM